MLSYFKLATATLLTLITISFAQVTLTIDGTSLNYESTSQISGWQFDHDDCVSTPSGGATADAGFTISCSATTCLAFSFSGGFIPPTEDSVLLVDLGGECETLTGLVFAGEDGSALDVELSDGGETCPISECGPGMHLMNGDSADCFCMLDCEHAEGGCVNGCLDSGACNYNDAANLDDGSCEYAEENYDCDGNCTAGQDCAGECGGSAVDDECGVCGGPGETEECGCEGIPDGACDCDNNVDLGCGCGEAGPSGCDNACGSTAEVDECGECGGGGIADGACDCDGNVEDCAGECGGSAVVDECGECNGDGSSCGETSNVSIMYESDADIYGFQFVYDGEGDLISASGGDADLYGFSVSASSASGVVLGFSFSGSFIPAGSGVLTNLEVTGSTGCIDNLILSGSGGAALESSVDCILITVGDDDCEDADADGICDDVDDCVGAYDCAGNCNGSSVEDDCGVCDGDSSSCADCAGVPNGTSWESDCGCVTADNSGDDCDDCAGTPNGDAVEDECGVCGGDGTSCGDDHIDLSFGAIADGSMEILMTNTMAISGFQFNITGVDLEGASGGRAADAGFEVSTGVDGIVLGFSFTGGVIPAGSGVLTSLNFSALSDEACIVDEVLALDWPGGFYAINIGDCAALDYTQPSSTADVLYDSDSDIAGFQFQVDGDVTVTGVSGGAAEVAGFQLSTGNNTVLGFSMTGSVVPAGAGTLLTLEYTGDGSPCLSDLVLSDPYGNGLDATVDCLTISYEAPCDDADADGICDDVDDCVGTYDCAGVCNGTSELDDCGVCDGGNADMDCAGVCNGTSELDDCGVCDGGNADMDCAGECGGSAVEDACGVCGGDGSSCAPGVYGLSLNEDGNLDVTFDSSDDIYGFQFNVSAVTVTGASGGAAADAGFTTSTGNNTVLGFSFSGSFIPAGSGVLTVLSFEGSGEACLSDIVVSGIGGSGLDAASGDCATIEEDCDSGIYDCAGVCDGTAVEDCAGECGGSAASDDCGVCNGGNADDLGCGCFEPGPSGCDNACGSTLEDDECGVCGGDGSSCAPGVYGLSLNEDGNLDVTFDSSDDIYGFQFNVSAVTVTGASGGAAADAGFTTSTGNNTVLGFSFSGSFIPAGSGVLTVLSFEGLGEACLSDIVVSGIGGSGLDAASGDCATIEDDCPSGDYDCAGVCGGDAVLSGCDDACNSTAVEDCAGVCGGDAVLSGCDDACNSTAVEDCAGVCGGDAVVDECGVCNGDGIADGACDCAGNVADCAGECGGSAEVDECGECGGDGIADGACDCDGNVADCAGECGGSAENCPDWVDCPSCYENTASMTAIVLDALSGDQMYADGDILAAFDDAGNNRGIAILLYPIPFGPYEGTGLYEIQIRGDAAGDAISFKYYDASADEVLDSGTGYTFVIDDIIGDVVIPHEISVGAITLSIDIASGWNWFSLNVEGDMSIGSVMASLTSTDGDFIKSASASSTYYPDFGWYGGLDELGVIGMYKFNSANADLLVFSGAPVDPLSTPIDLASGWNWLGFTPQNDGATADALVSITTNEGDFIKNQGASSTYYSDFGWYGGLEVMAPTEGYMLSVAEGSTLTYPNFGADDALTRAKVEKDMPIAVSDWEVNYHDFEFNGHITMSIDSREDFYGDYIAAFVGDECRGVAERMYFPFGDSYMYSVMVYSNKTDGEELRFKYYDSAIGEIVEYAETIDFTSDMIVGDGFNTYSLSSEASDMQQPMTYGISDAYPNPFNPVTSFEYTIPEDGMVQVAIYDISGRMVSELVNGYQSAGSYPVVWDAQELSSGVYMVNMISGDYSTIQKVMLIK